MSPYGLHRDKHTEWWWRCRLATLFPGFSSILLRYQNTSTGTNTDSHTGKSSALWEKKKKRWVVSEEVEECFVFFHPSLSQLAQDAGSSMSYMRIRGVSETFHHRPFVSQPCRTLGASRGSWRLPVQRQVLETSTHLCFQPSVWNSAIWWALDAQARLIIWFRQNFFLPMFQNFYTIFLI